MLLGSAAPRAVDGRAAAAELQTAEAELNASQEALRAARDALSDASSEAKNAERMLADLETAIPKVVGRGSGGAACSRCMRASGWLSRELAGGD